jgi:signal transduction histidine kinase
VSWAVCWIGWALAVGGALAMRRRLALVADAEHELRGAATALGLIAERSPAVSLQIERMDAALADLAAARGARPPAPADLEAGRLAQVLANVGANAAEHGVGPVRVEVSNSAAASARAAAGRGRGLRIAKRAARELGGQVTLVRENGETRAVIELPARNKHRRAA